MIKDQKTPVFIVIFAAFLILFENSISNIISLHQSKLPISNNPFFNFEIVKNYGAAWGMLQNSRIFLIIFGILVVFCALYYAISKLTFNDKKEVFALSLFIGGALGNTLERIRLGYVLDYIKINFFEFPNFNLFDVCIVVGILLLILSSIVSKRRAK